MENCTGGTLLQFFTNGVDLEDGPVELPGIGEQSQISEVFFKKIIRQLLFSVKSMHEIGIAHRDLKPENIMIQKKDGNLAIRIIDFGLSKAFEPAVEDPSVFSSLSGTTHYVSPQIIKGAYDEKCDIWALGVVAYQLFSGGDFPFDGENEVRVYKSIRRGKFRLPDAAQKPALKGSTFDWHYMSEEAKDFIRYLLSSDAKLRPSAQDALMHKWFNGEKKMQKNPEF